LLYALRNKPGILVGALSESMKKAHPESSCTADVTGRKFASVLARASIS